MDLRGTRALTAAGVAAAALPGVVGVSEAGPVRVSFAGEVLVQQAEALDGVVVGAVLPVLTAAGAEASYDATNGHLTCVAPDGTRLEARRGSCELTVDGMPRDARTPLFEREGEPFGPLVDIAEAIGVAARLNEAAEELRLCHRLVQVDAYAADEAAVVYIRLSGPGTGTLHTLDDPPRAYVDFPGITWVGRSEALELSAAGGLTRLRWALLQEWPPVARVVADLEPGAQASFAQVADRLFMLTVRPGARLERNAPERLSDACIVINPAAGGADAGIRGASIAEKTVALDVAVRLATALVDAGARAVLTRSGDRSLSPEQRLGAAHAVPDADLILTIRCGESNDAYQAGVTTVYADAASRPFADALQLALVEALQSRDLGTGESPDHCLRGTGAPSVACTLGFLTSPEDGRRLASQEYRERAASALMRGIAACFADG